MDRKTFIKTSGIGLGFALVPSVVMAKSIRNSDPLKPKVIKHENGQVLNVIGDIQTHKLEGADTNNQITEWINHVSPGVGIPPHTHTKEDEIFRVVKGQVEIMVDGKATVLKAGDIAYAPKNVPHAWKVVGTEEASMVTSAFPSGIEHLFKELAQLPEGPPDFPKVAAICEKHGVMFA